MPVQGMREMQVMCNQQIDALVKCGTIDEKRYEGIVHFQRAINMPVQKEILINLNLFKHQDCWNLTMMRRPCSQIIHEIFSFLN